MDIFIYNCYLPMGIAQRAASIGHKVSTVRLAGMHDHSEQPIKIFREHRTETLAASAAAIVHGQAGGIQRHGRTPRCARLKGVK